ncbi:MAG TPA: DNA polymerase III subunit delta [Fimbriimonadaceae bacterium]|nr:DNA polymerase III subunit delta [Fimbriimonadaceae bacterium]
MKFDPTAWAKSTVVFIGGNEDALRRKALTSLLDAVGSGPEDFDFESFLADAREPSAWLGAASTAPFLGEYRTVVVRHVLRAEEAIPPDRLKTLPPTARLVLVADEEPGDENKQRRLATVRKHWETAVEKAGGIVVRAEADAKSLRSALRDEARARGKALTPTAADVLVEMTGSSFSRACDELEKLVLFVGDGEEIREADVRLVTTASREWNVFSMIDAAVGGQPSEALRQLRILIGSATRAEEAGQRSILPMLSRQFRLLWQARACIEAGVSPDRAPDSVRASFLPRPNLAQERPWPQGKAMDVARSLSYDQMGACLREVALADARLKGQLSAFSGLDTLERLLLRLIEIVTPQRAAIR